MIARGPKLTFDVARHAANTIQPGGVCGVKAMMSVAECIGRAGDCLIASQRSSDHYGQQAWQRWSDLWMTWSESLARLTDPEQVYCPLPRINGSSVATPILEKNSQLFPSIEDSKKADQLRARLALVR